MLATTMPEVIDDQRVIAELHRFCNGRRDFLEVLLFEHNEDIADQDVSLASEISAAWARFQLPLREFHRALVVAFSRAVAQRL